MGVRINVSGTFKMPVNFFVADANGKPEAWGFVGEFKRLSTEEAKEVISDAGLDDIGKLKKVLVGWKMTIIDTGDDIPFSPEAIDELCKQPKVAGVVFMQFIEKVGANREKN